MCRTVDSNIQHTQITNMISNTIKYPEPKIGQKFESDGAQTARDVLELCVRNAHEALGKNIKVLKTYPPKIVAGKWKKSGLLRMICACGFNGLATDHKYVGPCGFEMLASIQVKIGEGAIANPPVAIVKRYSHHSDCTYDKSKTKNGQRKGALKHRQRAKLLKSPIQQRPARERESLKELIQYRGSSVHAQNFNSRTKSAGYLHAFGVLKDQYARFHSWASEVMQADPDCTVIIEEFSPENAVQYYTQQVASLVDYTPRDTIFEKNQNIVSVNNNATYYHRSFVALGQAKRAEKHFLRYFSTDTAFCFSADQGGLMFMVAFHASLGWLVVSYAHVPAEDTDNWTWFVQKNVAAFPSLFHDENRERHETVIHRMR